MGAHAERYRELKEESKRELQRSVISREAHERAVDVVKRGIVSVDKRGDVKVCGRYVGSVSYMPGHFERWSYFRAIVRTVEACEHFVEAMEKEASR